jgi:hypothetical protein
MEVLNDRDDTIAASRTHVWQLRLANGERWDAVLRETEGPGFAWLIDAPRGVWLTEAAEVVAFLGYGHRLVAGQVCPLDGGWFSCGFDVDVADPAEFTGGREGYMAKCLDMARQAADLADGLSSGPGGWIQKSLRATRKLLAAADVFGGCGGTIPLYTDDAETARMRAASLVRAYSLSPWRQEDARLGQLQLDTEDDPPQYKIELLIEHTWASLERQLATEGVPQKVGLSGWFPK